MLRTTQWILGCLMAITLYGQTGKVEVLITGVTPEWGGHLRVALYVEDNFPKEEASLASQVIPVRALEQKATFHDVLPGEYAVAVYQDLNSDGNLNRYIHGAPKEPYGFSNNKYGRFGPPKFQEVAFLVDSTQTTSLKIAIE